MAHLTPAELARHLGVSGRTVRRYAEDYQAVFGTVARAGEHGPRQMPPEAATHLAVAMQALAGGRVASIREALTRIRDGGELPARPDLAEPVELALAPTPGGVLAELRAELAARDEAHARALAAIMAELEDLRRERLALPAPGAEDQAAELRALGAEVERLRVSLHALPERPMPRPRSLWMRFIRILSRP